MLRRSRRQSVNDLRRTRGPLKTPSQSRTSRAPRPASISVAQESRFHSRPSQSSGIQWVMDRPFLYLPVVTVSSFPLGKAMMQGLAAASEPSSLDSFTQILSALYLATDVGTEVMTRMSWDDLTAGLALSAWYLLSYYGVRGLSTTTQVPVRRNDFAEESTPLEQAGLTAARGGVMGLMSYWSNVQTTPLTDYSLTHPYRWVGELRQSAQVLPSVFQPSFEALPSTRGQMNSLLLSMTNGALFFGVYNLTHGVAQNSMLPLMILNSILLGSLGGSLISRYFNQSMVNKVVTEQLYSFIICVGVGAMSTPYFDVSAKFAGDAILRSVFVLGMGYLLTHKKGSQSDLASHQQQAALSVASK